MSKSSEKRRIPQVTTPVGVAAGYPKLKEPDTKFVADGVYTASVVLSPEQSQGLIKRIDSVVEEAFKEKRDALKAGDGKAKKKAKELGKYYPYEAELDDEGEETGNMIFKAKLHAKVTTQAGKSWTQRPSVWDAQGQELKGDNIPEVWNGSRIALSVGLSDYYTPKDNVVGVSLRLYAVQVVELVSGGGGSAESHGFGTYEGGYHADTSPFEGDDASGEDVPADEDEDF